MGSGGTPPAGVGRAHINQQNGDTRMVVPILLFHVKPCSSLLWYTSRTPSQIPSKFPRRVLQYSQCTAGDTPKFHFSELFHVEQC